MGQILDRIKNMGKTYFNEVGNKSNFQNILNQEDEELKRIIDELNGKEKSNSEKKNATYDQTNNNNKKRYQSNNNNKKRYQSNNYNSDNKQSGNQYSKQNSNTKQSNQTNQPRLPKEVIDALIILELNQNSNEVIKVEQIKLQYKKMIIKFHPDRFQNKSEIEKKEYEIKASKINNAYNVLKKHYNFN